MKIKKINYNKILKQAPKNFNYIKYIEKVYGEIRISSTPTEWEDGDITRLSWRFSGNGFAVNAKNVRDAVLIHYVLNSCYGDE